MLGIVFNSSIREIITNSRFSFEIFKCFLIYDVFMETRSVLIQLFRT